MILTWQKYLGRMILCYQPKSVKSLKNEHTKWNGPMIDVKSPCQANKRYFDPFLRLSGFDIVLVSVVEVYDQRIRTFLCSCLPVSVLRCKPVDHEMTEESKYVDAFLSS
jgi:hypothetical protein